jgi:hypothetical protein
MQEEALRLWDDFVWRDGAHFLDALTARYTYADANVARVYGKPPATGWSRLDFAEPDGRAGLLAQPAVLAASAKNEAALAIHRGVFVREQILCDEMPPPPGEVPAIPAPIAGQNDRQRLERHRRDPACKGCHAMLDPVGFGLARFDMIGGLRSVDSSGQPVDARGSLSGFDGAPEFDGAPGLARVLRESPKTAACIARQLFRWSHGRHEFAADECLLAQVEGAFRQAGSLRAVLTGFVRSDAFRYRRPHAANVRPEEENR